jgi:hypothetical protein
VTGELFAIGDRSWTEIYSTAKALGTVKGSSILDLRGLKLYDLKGTKIYKLSGELVGHLPATSAAPKGV